ncbi:Putative ribonuclease H protein At1g65750 [Linum perenne]
MELLSSIFPNPILLEIAGMTPPNKNLGGDLPVWGLEPNGIYSVKSGYILALGLSEEPNRVRWSAVWKWEGPQRTRICWEAGPAPGFTLNTDGSVLQPSGLAAAGGALRNWEGRIVDAFTINLGKCSITRAELTGAVMGMERAWDVGVRELTVQLDSLCAIKLLSDPGGTDHQHACIVERFRALMSRAWQVRILHIFREGNFLADHLANRGHEASLGLHVIDLSDHLLLHWARYDSVGGSETRRIVI